ncbi:MAG: hypothetical protein AAGC73_01010 [Verrucomicrobiota bacterium]
MFYGGGAFLSFILLAYFSKMKFGLTEAGIFLGFYSIVYSGGSFASLGLYSRAPSWVIRDRDRSGNFLKKHLVLAALVKVTLLSVLALTFNPQSFNFGNLPVFLVAAGILQVAMLMMLCGLSNGYKNFHCSRLNFVIAPNFVAIGLFFVCGLPLMPALVAALMGCNIIHFLLIGRLSQWRTDVASLEGSQGKHATFSIAMILPVAILSILPQIDIWVLYNLLEGGDIFIYTFFARFLMIPMFPVISFNNVMYSTLPGLAYAKDFEAIERAFFGKYKRIRLVVVAAAISLPVFAYIAAQMVGVPFDWRAIGLLLALIMGYGCISLFPPYEVLIYAFEAQSQSLLLSMCVLLLSATGVFLMAATPYFWLSPLIPAAGMLSMRYAYKSIYEAKKKENLSL